MDEQCNVLYLYLNGIKLDINIYSSSKDHEVTSMIKLILNVKIGFLIPNLKRKKSYEVHNK